VQRRIATCVIVMSMASAAAAGRSGTTDVAGDPGAGRDEAVAAARAAICRYFRFAQDGQVDLAVAACHATDKAEAALALAFTKLEHAHARCEQAVQHQFGEEAVTDTVCWWPRQRAFAQCPASAEGEAIAFEYSDRIRFYMVRAGGQWKLSMRHLADAIGRPTADIVRDFEHITETMRMIADGVPRGTYRDVAAVQGTLEARGLGPAPSATASAGDR
jgi:hypothetical protein